MKHSREKRFIFLNKNVYDGSYGLSAILQIADDGKKKCGGCFLVI